MPLISDLTLAAHKFSPDAISEKTIRLNEQLEKLGSAGPTWNEVGWPEMRKLRLEGKTWVPKPKILEGGKGSSIPSRDAGRDIPTRVFEPEKEQAKGVFLHIHGGGWVLMNESTQDAFLQNISEAAQLTVISVGYRLSPEDPFPAGVNDCYDAAEWLVDHAKEAYGAELLFTGGESAGGHLSSLVCLHLINTRPSFSFHGLVLNYGCYELSSMLPQAHHWSKNLILTKPIVMDGFIGAFLPNTTESERRHPSINPFYADLREAARKTRSGRLPPALFAVGTEDVLMDDSVMMAVKWMMSGSEAVLKVYPGAVHGFTAFSKEMSEEAGMALEDMKTFLVEKVG